MTTEMESLTERNMPHDNDPYVDMRERYPQLFEPIPQRIGETLDNPEGYPNGSVAGWRNTESPDFIAVEENNEPLINVNWLRRPMFTTGDYNAKLDNSGYNVPLAGSTLAQYVREGVGEKLDKVGELLPENCRLVVFDAWRSLETQQATYEMCYRSLIDKFVEAGILQPGETVTPEAQQIISNETQKFISLPSPLPDGSGQADADRLRARQIPSPHNTGGSVDLGFVIIEGQYLEDLRRLEEIAQSDTDPYSLRKAEANFLIAMLYRKHAYLPDFGTEFDFAGAQSALTYYETHDPDSIQADSRRVLYNAMTGAGFEPYEEEWWHYNDGNQMAQTTKYRRTGEKEVARYGNVTLSEAQQEHERLHRVFFDELEAAHKNPVAAQNVNDELRKLGVTPGYVSALAAHIGDPSETESFRPAHDMKYRGELPVDLIAAVHDAQHRAQE